MPQVSALVDLPENRCQHHELVAAEGIALTLGPGKQFQILPLEVQEVAEFDRFEDGHAPPSQERLELAPRNIVTVDAGRRQQTILGRGRPPGICSGRRQSFIFDAEVAVVRVDGFHPVGQDVIFRSLPIFTIGVFPTRHRSAGCEEPFLSKVVDRTI